MKQVFLAVAIIAATFSVSIAQGRPTKEQNKSAIQNGRKQIDSKIIALEKSIKSHNAKSIKTNVAEVHDLMSKGLAQTSTAMGFEPIEKQEENAVKYNKMEMAVYQYNQLAKDPEVNAEKLAEYARTFQKMY